MKKLVILLIVFFCLLFLCLCISIALFFNIYKVYDLNSVDTFDECAARNYTILESYPRRCLTPDGRSFTEQVEIPVDPQITAYPTHASGDCMVTGCSSQICSDREVVTDCMYQEHYVCYKTATCERQSDGQCGWTEDLELSLCLSDPTS